MSNHDQPRPDHANDPGRGRAHLHDAASDHDNSHHHSHDHRGGPVGWLLSLLHIGGHAHAHGPQALAADRAFQDNQQGIRTVWIALGLLLLTTFLQVVIYLFSGSVALLADTFHNLGDALNSVPLLIAFYLARRLPTRRYNYGYHRAEDVAGVVIVLSIAVSAALIFYESIRKFIDPEPLTNLPWVAAAAVIGFAGNELVALIQIRVGRRIGSASLVTDGMHARTDGLTSLAVLVAAAGTWLGYPIVDPIVGILIGVAIVFITRDAAVAVWYRLMDAIEPELFDQAEALVQQQVETRPSLREFRRLRMRWLGHRLTAELHIAVDPVLTTASSHQLAEELRHTLFHAMPLLSEVLVHVEPWAEEGDPYHQLTTYHEPLPRPYSD